MDSQVLSISIFFYVVFLFSTVCHEAAHALVAKLGGDMTAYHGGQVTLNPMPHIQREPFGLGLLPIISVLFNAYSGGLGVFGFASAPYDPNWAVRFPKRAGWMAMAGPAANLLLSGLGILLLKVGLALGFFVMDGNTFAIWQLAKGTGELSDAVAVLFSVLFFENLLLGVWNLLPIPPMDGFSMFLFVLPAGKMEWFFKIRYEVGMMFPLLMFGLSGVFYRYFWPIVEWVVRTAF